MKIEANHKSHFPALSTAGLLVTLGIVFGDIGTSPLYVLQAIMGDRLISKDLIFGGLSAVFWTLTFQTTFKYVFLTLRADNKGEGGIMSLYALVRRKAKWLVVPAMIGGSALLADGIITPPISVTSAVEGLLLVQPNLPVVPIVIAILLGLFLFQRYGTAIVGKAFGPVMAVWFTMLAVLGISQLAHDLEVFKALNPYYAIHFVLFYPHGFWLLGAVFLCTTGAEALYSDLGHCGRQNIQVSWLFVKVCLLLNYFGQGAWLLTRQGQQIVSHVKNIPDINPFFAIVPQGPGQEWILLSAIVTATFATIIASQALISGSYTLISEAIRLNLWPKIRIRYPTNTRGQVYIPSINWLLCAGCIGITLHFQNSANMQAAYGLAITVTMLMTTVLLNYYLKVKKVVRLLRHLLAGLFLTIELSFLVANLEKFPNGGYVTLLVATLLITVMFVWFRSRKIKNRFIEFVKFDKYTPLLKELSEDESVPKYATNLVYLTSADYSFEIESKIMYSIFNKQPKRADTYWFVHVSVRDEPYTMEYKVDILIPDKVFRIDFRLGFRVEPRMNMFFRKAVEDLYKNKHVNIMSRYESLKRHNVVGDFRFVVIQRILNADYKFNSLDNFVLEGYEFLKSISLSEEKGFGLDTSSVTLEKVPLVDPQVPNIVLKKVE